MSKIDPTKGTTEMIIEALKDDEGFGFSAAREAQARDFLDNISIDEFLRGLIADADIEEVQTILDLIKEEDN